MSDNLNIQPEIEKEVNDLPPVDSKDSPDFLLSEFETSFSRTPGDILATDKHAKDYTLASFEDYKNNEAIQSAFRQSGVEFTEELYDAISKKKEIVSDYTSDIESISDGPVFDTATNRMLGKSISSNANAFIKDATMSSMTKEMLDVLTPSKIALAKGEMLEEGVFDTSYSDSFFKNFFGNKTMKMAATNEGFKQTEDGYFYLDEVETGEAVNPQDVLIKSFSTGFARDTFLDANRKNEPMINLLARKSPMIAAAALSVAAAPFTFGLSLGVGGSLLVGLGSLPFFADVAYGAGDAIAGIMGVAGEEKPEWINEYQHWINRMSFDATEDQLEHEWGAKAITSGVIDIFAQLAGMGSIAKGGAKAFNSITKMLNPKAAKAAKTMAEAGKMAWSSPQAALFGSALGSVSMGISASRGMYDEAIQNGLSEEHAGTMVLANIAAMSMISRIGSKLWSPAEKAVRAKAANEAVKRFFPEMVAAIRKNGVNGLNKVVAKSTKAGKLLGDEAAAALKSGKTASSWLGFAKNAVTEGFEEVTEESFMVAMKAAYNNTYGKGKEAGKGRYGDFELESFKRQAAMSFFYGAVAGGLYGTTIGKAAVGNAESAVSKEVVDYVVGGVSTQKEIDRQLAKSKKSFGRNNVSAAVDPETGKNLSIDKKSADPMRVVSEQEFNHNLALQTWQNAKDMVNIKLAAALTGGKTFGASIMDQFKEGINADMTKIKEHTSQSIAQIFKLEDELVALKLKAKDDTSGDYATAVNKKQTEIDLEKEKLSDIVNGKKAGYYKLEAIHRLLDIKQPLSEFIEMNEEILTVNEALKPAHEAKLKAQEDRSSRISSAKTADEMNEVLKEGSIDEGAKNKLNTQVDKEIAGLLEDSKKEARKVVEEIAANQLKSKGNPELIAEWKEEALKEIDSANRSIGQLDIVEFGGIELAQDGRLDSLTDAKAQERKLKMMKSSTKKIPTLEAFSDTEAYNYVPGDPEGKSIPMLLHEASNQDPGEHLKTKADLIQKRLDHIENLNKMLPYIHISGVYNDMDMNIPLIALDDENKKFIEELRLQSDYNAVVDTIMGVNAQVEKGKEAVGEDGEISQEKYLESKITELKAAYRDWKDGNRDPVSTLKEQEKEAIDEESNFIATHIAGPFSLAYSVEYPDFGNAFKEANEKLSSIKETNDFDDKLKLMTEAHKIMHDALQGIPSELRTKLIEAVKKAKKDAINFKLNLLERVDPIEFYTDLNALELPLVEGGKKATLTWEQQNSAMYTYAALRSNGAGETTIGQQAAIDKPSNYADNTKALGASTLDIAVFMEGGSGSGKSFTSKVALKMYQDHMAKGDKASKALTLGFTERQQNKLAAQYKGGVDMSNTEGHIDFRKLKEMVDKGDPIIDESGVIVIDEATFIPVAAKDKKGNVTDGIVPLVNAIHKYNKKSRKNNPLQILFIGDSKQQGYEFFTDGGQISYNIGQFGNSLERAPYLKTTQRTGYVSSIVALKDLKAKSEKSSGLLVAGGIEWKTTFGYNSDGKPVGIEVIESSEVDKISDSIQELIDNVGDDKLLYITTRDIATSEDLKELKTKYGDKISITNKVNAQGDEADYVLLDLHDLDVKESTQRETKSLQALHTMTSRGIMKTVIINNNKRRFESEETAQEVSEHRILESDLDAISKDTREVLSRITGQIVTSPVNVEEEVEVEEEADEVIETVKYPDVDPEIQKEIDAIEDMEEIQRIYNEEAVDPDMDINDKAIMMVMHTVDYSSTYSEIANEANNIYFGGEPELSEEDVKTFFDTHGDPKTFISEKGKAIVNKYPDIKVTIEKVNKHTDDMVGTISRIMNFTDDKGNPTPIDWIKVGKMLKNNPRYLNEKLENLSEEEISEIEDYVIKELEKISEESPKGEVIPEDLNKEQRIVVNSTITFFTNSLIGSTKVNKKGLKGNKEIFYTVEEYVRGKGTDDVVVRVKHPETGKKSSFSFNVLTGKIKGTKNAEVFFTFDDTRDAEVYSVLQKSLTDAEAGHFSFPDVNELIESIRQGKKKEVPEGKAPASILEVEIEDEEDEKIYNKRINAGYRLLSEPSKKYVKKHAKTFVAKARKEDDYSHMTVSMAKLEFLTEIYKAEQAVLNNKHLESKQAFKKAFAGKHHLYPNIDDMYVYMRFGGPIDPSLSFENFTNPNTEKGAQFIKALGEVKNKEDLRRLNQRLTATYTAPTGEDIVRYDELNKVKAFVRKNPKISQIIHNPSNNIEKGVVALFDSTSGMLEADKATGIISPTVMQSKARNIVARIFKGDVEGLNDVTIEAKDNVLYINHRGTKTEFMKMSNPIPDGDVTQAFNKHIVSRINNVITKPSINTVKGIRRLGDLKKGNSKSMFQISEEVFIAKNDIKDSNGNVIEKGYSFIIGSYDPDNIRQFKESLKNEEGEISTKGVFPIVLNGNKIAMSYMGKVLEFNSDVDSSDMILRYGVTTGRLVEALDKYKQSVSDPGIITRIEDLINTAKRISQIEENSKDPNFAVSPEEITNPAVLDTKQDETARRTIKANFQPLAHKLSQILKGETLINPEEFIKFIDSSGKGIFYFRALESDLLTGKEHDDYIVNKNVLNAVTGNSKVDIEFMLLTDVGSIGLPGIEAPASFYNELNKVGQKKADNVKKAKKDKGLGTETPSSLVGLSEKQIKSITRIADRALQDNAIDALNHPKFVEALTQSALTQDASLLDGIVETLFNPNASSTSLEKIGKRINNFKRDICK